jgi:predicted Zn-dependent protease
MHARAGVAVNRTVALSLCLIALILGWVAYSRMSFQPASASSPLVPKTEGSRICFVPIADFPTEKIESLVRYYRQKYNLEIAILNRIPVDSGTKDDSRQQLVAEKLAESVRSGVPKYAHDPKVILIGFTAEDIYPVSQNWRFAFGWRLGSTNSAVVSTARMGLHYAGEPSDPTLPDTRLRKMVTKDIGILYYGLSQSSNPKSVLYNQIMGIEELDEVGEDF